MEKMRYREENIILLVEDNSDDIELTRRMFTRNRIGNKLEWIQDGGEVLDYLFYQGIYQGRSYSLPSLILLSLSLPKMDVIDMVKKIRAGKQTSAIPVFLLISQEEERSLMREAGIKVDGFIQKPIDIDKLKKVVEGRDFSLILEEGKNG
jgi:two-component system response regulator